MNSKKKPIAEPAINAPEKKQPRTARVANPQPGFPIVHDITDRKQMEDAFRESETQFRMIIDSVKDYAIIVLDVGGHVVTWNAGAERIKGYQAEEIIGRHFSRFYTKEDIERHTPERELAVATAEGRIEVEGWRVRKDGSRFMANVIISALCDDAGHLRGFAKVTRDITERKRAEDTLRESEKRFRSLFENMLNGFVYCRMLYDQERPHDFIYLEVNRAFKTLTGLINVVGKKASEAIPGIRESDPGLLEVYGRVAITGIPETFEIFVEALKMWFSVSVYSPQKEYFVAVFDVITERKQAEKQLADYTKKLEERVEERTRELRDAQEKIVRQERLATLGQVAGSIGHELRNPLGVISNAIYFLKMAQPDASETIQEYLQIIENETRNSDKFITEMLDFTRIKALDRKSIPVSDLVRQTLEHYPVSPLVEVILELPTDLPQVYADPQQVVQVLGNLTVNACQSMQTGGKLTISAAEQSDMVSIAVRDTGEGISLENMGKLFEPLFTTKVKGIGLGLAVCRKLAEANGGRIEVKSEQGKGSTFTLYLPQLVVVPVA